MSFPYEILEKVDVVTLIAIAAMLYFFNSRLDRKFEKIDDRFEKMEQKMDQKFERIDEKLTDIDRRLCRLEGAFASKDCCMIKDDRHLRKAE